jgi:nicotinate-nucleotide adenylyltransferase
MNDRRIGVFGGTFDPPHVGHLILAMEAADQLKLEQVLWVLTPDPPHKQGKRITPIETRIALVEAAIDADSLFALSYVDINRPGPHYIVDTMRILQAEYPTEALVYLMGGDSLQDLLEWYKPVEFIDACDYVGVMRRPGEQINIDHLRDGIPDLFSKLEFIVAPLLEISSNQIRKLAVNGQPYRYYLPTRVYAMVQELGLYDEGEKDA